MACPLEQRLSKASDPDDLPFVEVAASGQAELIITGNFEHFIFFSNNDWGIKVVSPRECYDLICKH